MIIAVDHVRDLLRAVQHAADTFDGVDATPSVDGTPDALAAALRMGTPTETGRSQASDGAGALFWVLMVSMWLVVPCLVFCFFRYFDRGGSSTSADPKAAAKPKAGAAAAPAPQFQQHQQLPSSSSLSSWSAVGSACSSYVPPRGSTSVPGGARAPAAGKQLSVRAACGRMDSLAAKKMKSSVSGEMRRSSSGSAARATKAKASAKFMVPVDSMMDMGDAGRFSIVDAISGQTLLVVLSQNDQGFRRLQLLTETMALCASAGPPEGAQGGVSRLELRGPGGLLLGSLAPREDGTMAVHRQGQPQLIIWGNEDALDLEVSTEDGQPTATVSCTQDGASGAEHVEVSIFDGSNVQLVVCCIFAILFLCGEGA